MNNKLLKLIGISLVWFAIFTALGIYAKKWWVANYGRGSFEIETVEDIYGILGLAAMGAMLVFVLSLPHKSPDMFSWMDKIEYEPNDFRKRKAAHPDPDPEFLSSEPDGLVLGKWRGKFVRVKLQKGNILNAIIMGGPGCGKSVLIETMILYQWHHKPKKKEKFEPMTFYCTDIKPELAIKGQVIVNGRNIGDQEMLHVMNPDDRLTYGWDPYYKLTNDSSDDEIMSELDLIARALIDAGGADKNEFFYESARAIMKGILYWQYKGCGRDFMQSLNYILERSLAEVLDEVLSKIDSDPTMLAAKKILKPYSGKTGEAMEGIELSFRQSLSCFTTQTVQFFLGGNPKKASPLDLEKKISVFFCFHETKLEEYKCLLRLVTMQIMAHCTARPESSHMITLIVDEAARLGAINWTSFLATSRSRQVATILAFQSMSQMQKVWGKEDAKSLMDLCRVMAVLSCTDPEQAETLSKWAGEYKDQKRSINRGAKREGSYSESYDDKSILKVSDIMTLQDGKNPEVLLFIKGKYMRVPVMGARYYMIPELNKISQQCLAKNTQNKEVKSNE